MCVCISENLTSGVMVCLMTSLRRLLLSFSAPHCSFLLGDDSSGSPPHTPLSFLLLSFSSYSAPFATSFCFFSPIFLFSSKECSVQIDEDRKELIFFFFSFHKERSQKENIFFSENKDTLTRTHTFITLQPSTNYILHPNSSGRTSRLQNSHLRPGIGQKSG